MKIDIRNLFDTVYLGLPQVKLTLLKVVDVAMPELKLKLVLLFQFNVWHW